MDVIQQFWNWFVRNESKYRTSKQPIPESLLDELLENLHKVDDDLFFEVGRDPNGAEVELVITPEGVKSKTKITKELVSKAPQLPHWKFVAFRPAMGFVFTTSYEGVEIDPQAIWFLPLNSEQEPSAIGIRVGVTDYSEEQDDKYINGCYIALDTCLGEESVMENIQYLDVCELPENPEEEGFIEFTEIGKYIDWKHEQTKIT